MNGPRPRSRPSWQERQHRRRRNPYQRLLDRSFRFRLALALGVAILLLAGVNRWEHCRHEGLRADCLLRDAGGIVTVGNVEALSIVTAALLYVLEGGRRRQREHQEAMELVLACQADAIRFSHARNDALECLSERGCWLDGVNLSHAQLEELQVPHARWRGVDLRHANLQRACLHDTDLQGSDLREADLTDADLRHADLRAADLRGARLDGADLQGADLREARLDAHPQDPCCNPWAEG